LYHAFSLSFLKYLIPVFLLCIPALIQRTINLRFSVKDIITGLVASVAVLIPFSFIAASAGKVFSLLPLNGLIFQLVGIALPEEVYFRGFLQERLGNTFGGVVVVSFLFAFMHIPQFVFYGDPYSLLTFFPSLVMGFLYWRTSNVLPSMVFHFLSNTVFLGFYDIL
jgi:membrane protease YdiL (CAAX protease family)